MFKFLKDGFKKAIDKFTKKIEEEGKEETIEKKEEIKEEVKRIDEKEIKKKDEIKVKEDKKPKEKVEEKESLFDKLKRKITTKKIDEKQFEEMFSELELMLLENNVALEVIDKIKESLKMDLVNVPIERKEIEKVVEENLKESLEELFNVKEIDLIKEIKEKKEKPYVILFLGVNGSGKTTTISKIAHLLKENKISSVLVAADTWRQAAIEQLEEHGKKLGIKVIKHSYGSDPAAVAFDGIKHCKSKNIDAVLIDTAGRQHSNKNLMAELQKIAKVAKPDLKIFVGEAITGNDVVQQSMEFNSAVEIDAIVLTKADIDERGGAMISISYVTGKPIIYLGKGQLYKDLEKFEAKKIINSIGI